MHARLLISLAVGFLLAADAKDEKAKKDLQQLQGAWLMAKLEIDGERVPEEKLRDTRLVIKGNKYTVTIKDKKFETTLTLDPTQEPKHVDAVFADGPTKDKVHRGIYEWKGDTFRLCRNFNPDADRPTEFATSPNTGNFTVLWKREPK